LLGLKVVIIDYSSSSVKVLIPLPHYVKIVEISIQINSLLSGLFLEKAGHTSYNKGEFKKINPLITGG